MNAYNAGVYMDWLAVVIALAAGFCLGLGAAFVLRIIHTRTARDLAIEVYRESEAERRANVEAVIDNVRASFGSLSLEALSKSTEEFLKLAKARLDAEREAGTRELDTKKELIDQQLNRMTVELESIAGLMQTLEKDRMEKFGELTRHLQLAGEQTACLAQATSSLREALASTKARGQWGERMAEDVLRIAGFVENVNYLKQKTIEGSGSRPDFTFLLPRNLRLNMDVKFPLDNYLRFREAQTDPERQKYRNDFMRDVKARIKEVTTREYINPGQQTIDYALLFIPNEQIYAFVNEQDINLVDEGIRSKVVLCSPATLFAVLAVVRQAVDAFALEQTSNEILSLMGAFKKQWDEFLKKLEVVGKRIEDAQKEYEALTTTRKRQLERPLSRIEDLRVQKGLEPASQDEGENP